MRPFFRPMVDEGYEWINCVRSEDYERFAELDGTSRKNTWTPIAVFRTPSDEMRDFKPSDFPWLGSDALILRQSAVDALRDLLEANGEILPLSTEDDVRLFVLNARVIDALDEANSKPWRFPGSNRIMRFKNVAFFPSAIEGVDLFRVPHRGSPTYVSERFVERVRTAGLRGLVFNEP